MQRILSVQSYRILRPALALMAALIVWLPASARADVNYSRTVQTALGVPLEGPSVLPLLDAALKARTNTNIVDANSPAADRLVTALLAGCIPNELMNSVLADSHVNQRSLAVPDPRDAGMLHSWYEWTDTMRLADGLVRRAEAIPIKDPRGVKLARAAMVLTAQSLISFDGNLLNNVPDAREGPHVGPKPYDLADLDAAQIKAFRSLFADKPPKSQLGPLSEALDKAITSHQPLSQTKAADDFLDLLFRSWSDLPTGPYYSARWEYAHQGWLYACLCRARKDDKASAKLDEVVLKMRKASDDNAVLLRWLDEMLSFPGPAPASSGVWRINSPDDIKPPL